MNENNRSSSFNFGVFFHNFKAAFRRLFWLPLVLALLLGGFGYYRQSRSYRPIYEAKALYTVSANYVATSDMSINNVILDSNAASKLTRTFPYVMSTDAAKQMIFRQTGSYSLPASVSGSSLADSSLFTITATGSTPESVRVAMETVVAVYPQAAANILGNITLEPFEEPIYSDKPVNRPSPTKSVVKYALIGLALGLGVIALLAYMRKTVHTPEDLRRLVNTPCLGLLPNVRFKARTGADRSVVLTNPKIGEAYPEAVRSLRFKLRKELERQSAKVIMITSTSPGEGKTSVAANLALSLSDQGKRVILIDADLRKPSLKAVFGVTEPSEGLAELINGNAEKITPLTVGDSGLLLISGGKAADQPQRFLASPRLKKIVASLREQMDVILIDTPPTGLLADAATLAPLVDGVLYVVRQDYVDRSAIADGMQSLAATDVRFLGCVINNAERSTTKYGYGYRGGYGSKYGGYYGYNSKYYYGKKDKSGADTPTEFVK